jgi:hypothetical protein
MDLTGTSQFDDTTRNYHRGNLNGDPVRPVCLDVDRILTVFYYLLSRGAGELQWAMAGTHAHTAETRYAHGYELVSVLFHSHHGESFFCR